jgi:LAO/AO transport system kinase
MEIADFFVLNKADRPGADQAVMSIKMILGFRPHDAISWMPDVLKTVASEGKGIQEIGDLIARHRSHLQQTDSLMARRRKRMKDRIEEIVQDQLKIEFWSAERSQQLLREMDAVMNFERTPYQVAQKLLSTL